MKTKIIWLTLVIVWLNCLGKAGDLDTSFGTSGYGYTLTHIDSNALTGRSLVRQSDGKIVVTGNYYDASTEKYSVIVARYTSSGNPDTTFGSQGITKTTLSNSTIATCVALQSTGKIIVAAYYAGSNYTQGLMLLRYTSSGIRDTTFGSGKGYVKTFINPMSETTTMVVDKNNKIIIGGWYYSSYQDGTGILLTRYTASGAIDKTFGSKGYVKRFLGGYNSVIQAMLRTTTTTYLFATGSASNASNNEDSFVLKTNGAGVLVSAFGTSNGYTKTAIAKTQRDIGLALALQSDGKIVVAGEYFNTTSNNFKLFLTRYTTQGKLDKTFGHGGVITTSLRTGDDHVSSVLIYRSKIILVGSNVRNRLSSLVLARYTAAGARDTSFGTNGVARMPLSEAWSNGAYVTGTKLVVVGGSNYGSDVNQVLLARFKLS